MRLRAIISRASPASLPFGFEFEFTIAFTYSRARARATLECVDARRRAAFAAADAARLSGRINGKGPGGEMHSAGNERERF